MLQVQVEYWKQGEEVRHDQEMERLEAEKQKETQRANRAGEEHRAAELQENIRHALETERVANWQTAIQQRNAESQERQSYAAQESARASVMQAQASQMQAQAAQQQARTAAYNAETQRLNYEEQKSQNIRSNNLKNLEVAANVKMAGYSAEAKERTSQNASVANIVGSIISGIGRVAAIAAK